MTQFNSQGQIGVSSCLPVCMRKFTSASYIKGVSYLAWWTDMTQVVSAPALSLGLTQNEP
eukprot:scaffold229960_cov52-Prasinocladus_malaysianus.AAC.2